jgi:hypothetical protein
MIQQNVVKMARCPNPLRIQCTPQENSIHILHRNRKNNPEIHMEAQKTQITEAILSKEKKSNTGGITVTKLLQSHGNKNSMASAHKQTPRPVE